MLTLLHAAAAAASGLLVARGSVVREIRTQAYWFKQFLEENEFSSKVLYLALWLPYVIYLKTRDMRPISAIYTSDMSMKWYSPTHPTTSAALGHTIGV